MISLGPSSSSSRAAPSGVQHQNLSQGQNRRSNKRQKTNHVWVAPPQAQDNRGGKGHNGGGKGHNGGGKGYNGGGGGGKNGGKHQQKGAGKTSKK